MRRFAAVCDTASMQATNFNFIVYAYTSDNQITNSPLGVLTIADVAALCVASVSPPCTGFIVWASYGEISNPYYALIHSEITNWDLRGGNCPNDCFGLWIFQGECTNI